MARVFLASGALLGAVTASAAVATPWAVIKCKFSDQPAEPFFDPNFILSPHGAAGYWLGVSYGQISLEGSAVHGWYTLPITLAQAQGFPAGTKRSQIINACRAAATDVDFTNQKVMAIVNAVVDSGSVGGSVLLDPQAWNMEWAAHEMGHCYGLGHSFDDSGIKYDPSFMPGEYGDGWDIMSALAFFGSPSPTFDTLYGPGGPGLNAPNLNKLGWLAGNRIFTMNLAASQTVTLAALNRPAVGGYLMVKVLFNAADTNDYYTIEFRRKTDWDQGIQQSTVLIHEVRSDGISYLIKANGGPQRLAGQTFRDVTNNVAITVLNIDNPSETATVSIGRNELWVDFAYGGLEFGSFDNPFQTVAKGVLRLAAGGILNFKTGSSAETASISKSMTLKAFNGPVIIGLSP